MLFELIGARYENRSLLVIANEPFSAWGKIFGGDAMTLAAVDRLVHRSHIFELNVESYRRRAAIAARQTAAREADGREARGRTGIGLTRPRKRFDACRKTGHKAENAALRGAQSRPRAHRGAFEPPNPGQAGPVPGNPARKGPRTRPQTPPGRLHPTSTPRENPPSTAPSPARYARRARSGGRPLKSALLGRRMPTVSLTPPSPIRLLRVPQTAIVFPLVASRPLVLTLIVAGQFGEEPRKAGRPAEAVLRLLRGEDIGEVSREVRLRGRNWSGGVGCSWTVASRG